MKDATLTEQMAALQRLALPPAAVAQAWQQGACCFWEGQDTLLENLETFAKGWFERRRAGTRAALDAAQRMSTAETPADVLREQQQWWLGAFERLVADGLAFQEQALAAASALAPPMEPLADDPAAPAAPAGRSEAA